MKSTAIYPGTFDTITFGHIDVIKKSLKIFNNVIIAAAENINKDYLYKKEVDLKLLFNFHDYSKEIKDILPTLPKEISILSSTLKEKKEPNQEPSKSFCGDCAFWDYCTQNKPKDWTALIPRLNKNKYTKLLEMGIESMSSIPDDFEISDNQRVVVESTKNRERFLNKEGLQKALED